jgi:hypothetical protein
MTRDESDSASVPAGVPPPRPRVSAWALMLGSGPRFARNAFGPVLVFYVAWKLIGFQLAILAATALAIAAYIWERRQARSGITAGIGLGIALVQATAGLAAGSTTAYFAPPIIVNGAYGLAFLTSAAIGRSAGGHFRARNVSVPTPGESVAHLSAGLLPDLACMGRIPLAPDRTAILRPVTEQCRTLPGAQRRDRYSLHGGADELVDLVQRAELPTKRRMGPLPH